MKYAVSENMIFIMPLFMTVVLSFIVIHSSYTIRTNETLLQSHNLRISELKRSEHDLILTFESFYHNGENLYAQASTLLNMNSPYFDE